MVQDRYSRFGLQCAGLLAILLLVHHPLKAKAWDTSWASQVGVVAEEKPLKNTVVLGGGGCDTLIVVLNANGPFCGSGLPELTGTLTGTGPWSITYTTNNVSPVTVGGIASSSYTINPAGPITSTTTYAITAIIDGNGCGATNYPEPVQVVVNPRPTATITPGGPTTFCQDGSVQLNANTGTGLTYQWQLGGNSIAGATSSSYSATTAGSYTVVVSNIECSNTSSATSVIVNALPTATITAAGPTTFCQDGSVQLNANTGTGLTYQWQLGGNSIAGATSSSYSATTAGSYTVVVTTSAGCNTVSSPVQVTVIAPNNPGSDNTLVFCSADLGTIPLADSLGVHTVGGTWTSTPSVTLIGDTLVLGTLDPGTYVFNYVVGAVGPCPADTASITVELIQQVYAGMDSAASVCNSISDFSLVPFLGSGVSEPGDWYTFGQPYVPVTEEGSIDPSGLLLLLGQNSAILTYQYLVTQAAPCSNDVATVTVTIYRSPLAGTDTSLTVCDNDAEFRVLFDLLGDPDNTGTWSGTDTLGAPYTFEYQASTMVDGTYTYTVPGPGACSNDSATVTVNETTAPNAPTVVPVLDEGPYCMGQYVEFSVAQFSPDLTYNWTCTGCEQTTSTGNSHFPRWTSPGDQVLTITAQQGECYSLESSVPVVVRPDTASCPKGIVYMQPHGLAVLDASAGSFQWGRLVDGAFVAVSGRRDQTTFDAANIDESDDEPYYVVRTSPDGQNCWTTTTVFVGDPAIADRECWEGRGAGLVGNELRAFPNPINGGALFLDPMASMGDAPVDILLFDGHGRIVHSERVVLTERVALRLDASMLAHGIYLLQARGASSTEQVKLFIQ